MDDKFLSRWLWVSLALVVFVPLSKLVAAFIYHVTRN